MPKAKAKEGTEEEMTVTATAETGLVEAEAGEERLLVLWSATSAAREAISLGIAVDATEIDEVATETATGIDETEAEIAIVAETDLVTEATTEIVAVALGTEVETRAGIDLAIEAAIDRIEIEEKKKGMI